ncbi:MAG: type II secretion system secretin GspD [Pseudomonadota bacterium]
MIRPDALQPTAELVELARPGEFSVNLIGVPIAQASAAVLGDTLGLDYVIQPGVEGIVTIQTSQPLRRADLFSAFATALELSGYAVRRDGGRFVVTAGVQPREFRLARDGRAPGSGVYVIPLAFIGAAEMERILQPIAGSALTLSTSPDRNLLFASGRRADVESVLEAVNLFDVDLMAGKSVSRIQLVNMSATDVAVELEALFDSGPGGALEGTIEFLPNESLASLLIISARAQYVARAENFVRSLEASMTPQGRVTVVYELENRSAEDLAPTIAELLALGPLQVAAVQGVQDVDATNLAESAAPLQTLDNGGPRILADDVSNTIIAYATPGEHDEIDKLLHRLDEVADQVLIEATIAEVVLNDALDFGVRYFFETGNFTVNFTSLETLGVAPFAPGFNAIFDDGGAAVALNALATVSDVKILSSPSLLVLDNREATLSVGDEIPVTTQTSVSVDDPGAPIVNSVEYRDTGVILTLRPRVSSRGRVILDVRQEVSDVVTTATSGIDSPTIQQRIVESTVAVDDGQAIVIGGLIRETLARTQQKIPLLGDIPLLGAAFRNTSDSDERTELLIIITPRVIRNNAEARAVTEEYREALSRPDAIVDLKPGQTRHQLRRIFF